MPRPGETTAEWQARMRSISYMGGKSRLPKEKIFVRSDGGVDTGRKARIKTDELGTKVTESDNRQDVNVCPPTYYQEIGF